MPHRNSTKLSPPEAGLAQKVGKYLVPMASGETLSDGQSFPVS